MSMRALTACLFICVLSVALPSAACADDADSLTTLDALRAQYPHDVDHALARAQLLARMGNDEAALRDLRDAAALAPHYEDVWRVYYAVLRRQDSDAASLERQQLLEDAARRFPNSAWWRVEEPADEPSWTIALGSTYENLDNGQPSWKQLFTNASHEANWGHYRFGVSRDERFGESDVTVSIGGDLEFPAAWRAGLDIATVSDARFQPELSYAGHVARSLHDGWVLNLEYGQREYSTATVSSIVATIEKYAGNFRLAYALGNSRLNGAANSLNHRLSVSRYYGERASIGINLTTGEESEAISANRVLQTRVRSISVNGRQELNESMDVLWWLGTHEQGDFYRRTFIGVAVSFRI